MADNRVSRRRFLKSVGAVAAAAAFAERGPMPRVARAASTTAGKVRFGVQTPPQHVAYHDLLPMWQEADELGFDTAFVFDHFIPIYSDPSGPCLEGWTLLSALAAQTKRVQVGVLVTGNTYRNPAVLAKMAATVDHVSHGRLILGMGAGWFELEHKAYGIPFSTVGGRARQLGEALEVIKLLFTQEKSTYTGKYYQLKDALFEPKTVQKPHPPILIGGQGPKLILPLIARHANIWHLRVGDVDPEGVKQIRANFDAICRKVGRDPAEVEKAVSLRSAQLAGATEEVRRQIQALADVGIRHFIISLSPTDRKLLGRFAKEIMPAFRET
ncbi:MAG TPA: TIGR03560 family F420-dependent LLM class oxidoreductase [Candidatus Binatia bacterium]|nr:TIGR03560 family F420-dependent LLM class oxidoreductase [Candidatus Binatia bacterium]